MGDIAVPDDRIVALLPMKHESERVPGKNYRDFGGRPLFRHVLDTLLGVDRIERVVIDTDSPIIEDLVAHVDRVTVLPRPDHLLGGDVPMNDIIAYDMTQVDAPIYLQTHSTNPFLTASTVLAFLDAYLANQADVDSAFTVTKRQQRFWTADGKPVNHDPTVLLRTQDLPGLMEENSCGYLFTQASFQKAQGRIGTRPLLFEMDPIESLDIDTEADFKLALALLGIREARA